MSSMSLTEDLFGGTPQPQQPTQVGTDSASEADATELVSFQQGTLASGLLWSSDQLAAAYNEYLIDTHYETNQGLRQLALASDEGGPESCAIVAVSAPVSRKRVQWTVERIGMAPICPHWDTGNDNEVLLRKRITPCSTWIMPDGKTQVWRVEGIYEYALLAAVDDADSLYAGAIPVAILESSTQIINGQNFSTAILASTSSASGASAATGEPPDPGPYNPGSLQQG
jgi:hypothetical protein